MHIRRLIKAKKILNLEIKVFFVEIKYFLVILPANALKRLSQLQVAYPMFFRLTAPTTAKKTFCGVLEFIAEDREAYLPDWMMKELEINEGGNIILKNVKLSKGIFAKIQPFETKFINLPNPKAMYFFILLN